MLRIYRLKRLPHIVLVRKMSVSLHQMGWQLGCHLQTGRNVKDASPEKFNSYCFSKKMSVSLYQMGWQFSCHLLIGKKCYGFIA